jgi:NAD(P)-dependent dehydrogenase (short-subunit alcohol dehydrogenase family)
MAAINGRTAMTREGRRRGTPWDVAYAMNYIISPAAQWVTHQEFILDGGDSYKSKMPSGD